MSRLTGRKTGLSLNSMNLRVSSNILASNIGNIYFDLFIFAN